MIDTRALPSVPYPLTDLEQLGEEIATLSAQIQAATYKLLVLIRDFDAREGWGCGFASCAHWLCWRTGLDLGAAREKVRVARALYGLPLLSAAMSRGEVSYSKVRALTRVATTETEGELLVLAKDGTAAHVERLVRVWRRADRSAEAAEADLQHAARYVTTYLDEDGMLVLRARLEPEAGALVEKALEAADEKLYPQRKAEPEGVVVPMGQRRADALALIAESALSCELDRGTSSDRYQVVVHVFDEDLEADRPEAQAAESAAVQAQTTEATEPAAAPASEAGGGSDTGPVVDIGLESLSGEEWIHISAETSRRVACDAATTTMTHAADGRTLDVGRKSRTIPPSIRRALWHRDAGCRFPGCRSKSCDAHHVHHWANGGETKLRNLVLLCRRHHRAVHEEGFRVEMRAGGRAIFRRPDGRRLEHAPRPPELGRHPLDDLLAGLEIEALTTDGAFPGWQGGPIDYGMVIDALWRPETEQARVDDTL